MGNGLAATENGVIVFAASTGREKSLETDENGYSTKALIDGLNILIQDVKSLQRVFTHQEFATHLLRG